MPGTILNIMNLAGMRRALRATVLVAAVGSTLSGPVYAQQRAAIPPQDIWNDTGGQLSHRVQLISNLRGSDQPIRIKGNVCYSTCTLYLGLAQTCVSPDTVFGFHGPSSFGRPLAPDVFERASQIIVYHYPPVLHEWYMTVARHELRGLLKVDGRHLSRIGAARLCKETS